MKPLPIDVAEVQRLFYIDENDFLRWKIKPAKNVQAGDLAGAFFTNGNGRPYIRVTINGKGQYLAHRIIWALRNERDPGPKQIDHKDDILVEFKGRQVLSNAKSNLRLATHQQNTFNKYSKGVYYVASRNKCWKSQVTHKGKYYFLGYFFCYEKAKAAYIKAKKELCGRFAHSDIRFA